MQSSQYKIMAFERLENLDLEKKYRPNKHLHSKEHLLAEDLSRMMLEPKKFAAYLGLARFYHESDLRALAGRVAAKEDLPPEARGKYFFAAVKGLFKKKRAKLKNKHRRKKTKKRLKKTKK